MNPRSCRATVRPLCDDTEYLCLLRHYGKIQQEISLLSADQAQQIAHLEAENIRLKAALIERDTELSMLREFIQTLLHEADQVICLTGCLSQGRPWRSENHCRRKNAPCEYANENATTDPGILNKA